MTSNASNEVVSAFMYFKEQALKEAEEYAESLVAEFVTHLSMMSASEILSIDERSIGYNVRLEIETPFRMQVFKFLKGKNIDVVELHDDDGNYYYRLTTKIDV